MEDDSFTDEERNAIAFTPNGEYGAQLIYEYEQKQLQEEEQSKQVLLQLLAAAIHLIFIQQ
jgi:hypothetical protein